MLSISHLPYASGDLIQLYADVSRHSCPGFTFVVLDEQNPLYIARHYTKVKGVSSGLQIITSLNNS
jgi:hypothetical protein